MNQQLDYDVPNKTWKDGCEAACEHWGGDKQWDYCKMEQGISNINKFLHSNPIEEWKMSRAVYEHFPESQDSQMGI